MTMKLGEIAKITIAGYKGYGASGFPAWGYPLVCVCVCVVCVLVGVYV